jgi:predicted nucleic acid-binding protein
VTGPVFIDSGAFIAFLDRSDRRHSAVVALFSRKPRRWSTSTLVLAETYGWFLHRLGEDAARRFRLFTDELPQLQVLGAGSAHRRSVSDKLEALRGCKLTYVDASSLVWLEEKNISAVWGTDHHLAVEGATVMPGPPSR